MEVLVEVLLEVIEALPLTQVVNNVHSLQLFTADFTTLAKAPHERLPDGVYPVPSKFITLGLPGVMYWSSGCGLGV